MVQATVALVAVWLLAVRLGDVALGDLPLVPWLMTASILALSRAMLVRPAGGLSLGPAC